MTMDMVDVVHTIGVACLGMSRSQGIELTERFEIVHRELVS